MVIENIGNGIYDTVEIPNKYIETNDIVNTIYNKDDDLEVLSNMTILTSKNEHVEIINSQVLEIFNAQEKIYLSVDSIVTEDNNLYVNYPLEFLNAQKPSGIPPHILKLKVGAIIMFLRNINLKKSILNGIRMVVNELHNNFIVCTIISGRHKGYRALITRINIAPSETTLPFVLKRKQFPIMLTFAMTIHKSQDQSFDRVGLYLSEDVFTHGQLYVALSHIKNP